MPNDFMPFETDRAGWLALIVAEYDRIVAAVPQLVGMRPANLALGERLTTSLGLWDESRRTITLSHVLLEGHRWQLLVRVLRHEMAHQVVSEVFGVAGAVPHGEAFGRACALLGVDPAATIDPAALEAPAEHSDVHRKIRKLLALGESPNRHEAEAALKKASYLAMKHNIVVARHGPPAGYAFRLVSRPRKRFPAYTWLITQICTDHYFVRYICRGWDDTRGLVDGGRYQVIEMYGTPDNLDLAEYVFNYLLHQGEIAWTAYRRDEGLTNNRQKRSFLSGLYAGFGETLDRQRSDLAQSRALVWTGDPGLEAFYRQRNPYVTTSRSSGQLHHGAHVAGQEVGARLRIRPGIRTGELGVRGYLGGGEA